MVIVVPSWNNNELFNGVPRYQLNLDSIFSQKYSNYRVIYIDDCSSDRTADMVASYINKRGQTHRVTLIRNTKRWGPSRNRYVGAHMAHDEEIVMYLDGDDWFSRTDVLNVINQAYSDPNVWLTYSHFIHAPDDGRTSGAREIPQWVIEQNAYRKYGWDYHSLKTFYGWLFKQLRLEDILFEGKFLPVGSDIAEMLPLVELSGGRFKFIKDILYVASVHGTNEINIAGKNLLNAMWHVISNMTPYVPLDQRPEPKALAYDGIDIIMFIGIKNNNEVNSALDDIFKHLKGIQTVILALDNTVDKLKIFNYLKSRRKNFIKENIVLKNLSELTHGDIPKSFAPNILLTGCGKSMRSVNVKQAIGALSMTYALFFFFGIDAQDLDADKINCLQISSYDRGSDVLYAFSMYGVTPKSAVFKRALPCLCSKETLLNFLQSAHSTSYNQFVENFSAWNIRQPKKLGLCKGKM